MNKKLVLSLIFTFLYALVTLIAVLHHEIWADEAQVWQLCKYMSFSELITHLHNEGHPAVFYLLVMLFAKIFPNIICMQLICWLFMVCAAGLFIYFSPFKAFTKFAVLSSAGFLYFLPVMARSYSILPFLVFLAAILYSKSKEHPILYALILCLILNTHSIMLAFSVVLAVMFIAENYKSKKNICYFSVVYVIGFLIFAFQLYDSTSSNTAFGLTFTDLPVRIIKVFSFFFINAYNKLITVKAALQIPLIDLPLLFFMVCIYIVFFINLFFNNKKIFLLAFLSIGFQFFIYIFMYSANTYVIRIFTAHLILLFCFWILLNSESINEKYKICSKKTINVLISLFFILTLYNGINYYLMDIKQNYAGAKVTAEYIKNNIDAKNSVLLINNEPFCVSLAYYLNDSHNLYSIFRNRNFKYVIWDDKYAIEMTYQVWVDYISYSLPVDKDIYVIRSYMQNMMFDSENTKNNKFVKVFSSGYSIEPNEGYVIYKYVR